MQGLTVLQFDWKSKKSACDHTQKCSLIFFWKNLTTTKAYEKPHCVLLQLRKSQFLPLAIPFSMHAGVYTQHLDICFEVSVLQKN